MFKSRSALLAVVMTAIILAAVAFAGTAPWMTP